MNCKDCKYINNDQDKMPCLRCIRINSDYFEYDKNK